MFVVIKNSNLKRIIRDFRFLNNRLQTVNSTYPLIRDTFFYSRSSKFEYFSVLDLKDKYHTIELLESYKCYCGILPYFGSDSYVYPRIPYRINCKSSYMAISHKCYSRQHTWQVKVYSNYRWSTVLQFKT